MPESRPPVWQGPEIDTTNHGGNHIVRLYLIATILLFVVGLVLVADFYLESRSLPLASAGVSLMILGGAGIIVNYMTFRGSAELREGFESVRFSLPITLALFFAGADAILAHWQQPTLDIYYLVNAIVFIIIAWCFIALKPQIRPPLSLVGVFVFTWALVLTVLKVIDILS